MATRIPISWLIVVILVAVFGFFAYHILQASGGASVSAHERLPSAQSYEMPMPAATMEKHVTFATENGVDEEHGHAPAAHRMPPRPKQMPRVPGQTEEDLRAPEPLQETPPAMQYDAPEANDELNANVFMGAGFGSNLRHPEQMFESHPQRGMGQAVSSGLASEHSNPGRNRPSVYSPEMIQNAGEFMQGVSAFDGSEVGTGFSSL